MPEPKITPTVTDQLKVGNAGTQPLNSIGQQVRFITPALGDPFKARKVAIVGTQPSSRMLAPWGDPTWTIWGTSPGNMGTMPRVDAWVEMHCNFLWPQYAKAYGEQYLAWMNAQTFPVMAQDQRLIKRAISYPIAEMYRIFGPYFFTSTFAYCMAYAIHIGVEEMALYGVDMSSKDEYIKQRPGGHYFIQRAREAGIKVIIPQESDLEQPPPLYGYSDASDLGRKQATRRFEIEDRITQLEQQLAAGNQQLSYLKGAREDVDYNESVFASAEQHALFREMERAHAMFKTQLPQVEAPPMADPVAGLNMPCVLSNAGIGDRFGEFVNHIDKKTAEVVNNDLRPRIPGKRGMGKRKRGA